MSGNDKDPKRKNSWVPGANLNPFKSKLTDEQKAVEEVESKIRALTNKKGATPADKAQMTQLKTELEKKKDLLKATKIAEDERERARNANQKLTRHEEKQKALEAKADKERIKLEEDRRAAEAAKFEADYKAKTTTQEAMFLKNMHNLEPALASYVSADQKRERAPFDLAELQEQFNLLKRQIDSFDIEVEKRQSDKLQAEQELRAKLQDQGKGFVEYLKVKGDDMWQKALVKLYKTDDAPSSSSSDRGGRSSIESELPTPPAVPSARSSASSIEESGLHTSPPVPTARVVPPPPPKRQPAATTPGYASHIASAPAPSRSGEAQQTEPQKAPQKAAPPPIPTRPTKPRPRDSSSSGSSGSGML